MSLKANFVSRLDPADRFHTLAEAVVEDVDVVGGVHRHAGQVVDVVTQRRLDLR
jgi:hypothetical protein